MILDTTALIATERASGSISELVADDDDVAMAAITVAELLVGVELADRRRRPARARLIELLLETVPVEPYDLGVARVHSKLLAELHRAGRPRGAHDLIIAATAIATARMVVTADARGFADLPGLEVRAPNAR